MGSAAALVECRDFGPSTLAAKGGGDILANSYLFPIIRLHRCFQAFRARGESEFTAI